MTMETWRLGDLEEQRRASGRPYLEFGRVPALNTGLYVLPAGGVDPQQPHAEDEVYYVIRGRATFVAGAEVCSVEAGTVIYVAAGVPHRFEAIEEELTILVFFAGGPATG